MTTQTQGQPIQYDNKTGQLSVPSHPVIPFIEGDGTGPDIWRASQRVLDAAVEKAYGGDRAIAWKEVLAGQKAKDTTGDWLPDDTIEAFKTYSSASRARSPRRSAAASARSTWRCGRSSTFTSAFARCSTSPTSPRR